LIREAQKSDAKRLSILSSSLLHYIFDADVPQWFANDFDIQSFEDRVTTPNYQHFVYVLDNIIVGYITIKEGSHLYNLFVDEQYHQRGIAKKLWKFVEENLAFDSMSTNASLYAIKAYESFGFKQVDAIQVYNETLKYQPMRYTSLFIKES